MTSQHLKQIPTLSLRDLTAQNREALEALQDACAHWGFFRLIDLDLSPDLAPDFTASMKAFFALPHEEKRALSRTESNPWGYYDQELTKNKQDWKEIYDLGLDQSDTRYESITPWPTNLAGFQTTMLGWHQTCETISLILLEAIAQSLGLDTSALTRHFTQTNSSFLRLNHYPVCETPANAMEDYPEEGHLGIYHHTDAGAVTVLLQDEVSGLQVRHNDTWVTIPAETGSLIINVGDLVQVWSNDRYRAPLHRVLANSERDRFSAAFFMNPAFATDCQPLTDESPLYKTVNWGDFRAARAAGDYANLGNEIQISDYRL